METIVCFSDRYSLYWSSLWGSFTLALRISSESAGIPALEDKWVFEIVCDFPGGAWWDHWRKSLFFNISCMSWVVCHSLNCTEVMGNGVISSQRYVLPWTDDELRSGHQQYNVTVCLEGLIESGFIAFDQCWGWSCHGFIFFLESL